MGIADWILLGVFGTYLLFNFKKVYYSFASSFANNGVRFTLWVIAFLLIFIAAGFIGVLAPKYGWITQLAFILYIVGFFIHRIIYGVRD
jgi:hypothetical protein